LTTLRRRAFTGSSGFSSSEDVAMSTPASFRILRSLSALLLMSVTGFAQAGPDQVGRILRGRPGTSDFDHLSPIEDARGPIANPRRIVMLTDAEGLDAVADLDGYATLKEIGYPDEDIAKYVKEGLTFQIVAFPAQGGVTAATWDNLITMLRDQYPGVDDIVEAHLSELKVNSGPRGYRMIMASAPSGATSTPMTAERLRAGQGELWEVRKFLHDQLNLNEFYMGDGFTYRCDGGTGRMKRGVREYFAVNKPIRAFDSAQVTRLRVTVPPSASGPAGSTESADTGCD
jgi:hypothetical protein